MCEIEQFKIQNSKKKKKKNCSEKKLKRKIQNFECEVPHINIY